MEIGRFPNKLKKYRSIAGYSQKKVAQLLGLKDTSLISRWEKGDSLPGTSHIFYLSRIYRTLPHILLHSFWNSIQPEEYLLTQDESFNTNEAMNL